LYITYIKIKLGFNLEGDKIVQFLQKFGLNLNKNKNTGTKSIANERMHLV